MQEENLKAYILIKCNTVVFAKLSETSVKPVMGVVF